MLYIQNNNIIKENSQRSSKSQDPSAYIYFNTQAMRTSAIIHRYTVEPLYKGHLGGRDQ